MYKHIIFSIFDTTEILHDIQFISIKLCEQIVINSLKIKVVDIIVLAIKDL